MRRLLTWLAGIAGVAALLRRRSRQRIVAPPSLPAPAVTDPAVELRQKLDQTREAVPEPPAEPEPTISLEERRRRVHERAKEAVDLMHGTGSETPADDDAT